MVPALVRVEEPVALDLYSRIELPLKGKISAALNTPAFLQLQLDGSRILVLREVVVEQLIMTKMLILRHLLLPFYLNKSI